MAESWAWTSLGVEEQLLIYSDYSSCLSPGRVKKLQKFINFGLKVGHSANLELSKSCDSCEMYKISTSRNGNDLRQLSFWFRRFRAEPTGLRKVSTSESQTYLHIAVTTIDRFHMTSRRPYLCTKQWIGGHVCRVQKNPVGIELFSHVKTFFYSKQFAKLLTTWLKTIYNLFTLRVIHKLKNLWYPGYDHRRLEKNLLSLCVLLSSS